MSNSGALAPTVRQQAWNLGVVAPGAKLTTQLSGTSTDHPVYLDADLTVAAANPLVADANGRFAAFWLDAVAYRMTLTASDDSAIWGPTDNIYDFGELVASLGTPSTVLGFAGVSIAAGQSVYLSDGSGALTAGRWYLTDADFTYASIAAPQVGIALAAISAGASGLIQVGGRVTNQSGLAAGSTYYASATAGAVTATAPTNARIIGVADSTTSLVLIAGSGFMPVLPVAAKSANYTLTTADAAIIGTGTWTLTLYAASGQSGHWFLLRNNGTGAITIDPNASETINGVATLAVFPGEQVFAITDGTTWYAQTPTLRRIGQLTTPGSVTNSVTETSLFSASVPANTAGTNRLIRMEGFAVVATDAGGTRNVNFRIKFGGTTLLSGNTPYSANQTHFVKITILIFESGATNSQRVIAMLTDGNTAGAATWTAITATATMIAGNTAAAIDTTAAQTFDITAQMDSAQVGFTTTLENATLSVE